jgi:GNAT superfamily N-acetyltransferase
MSAGKHEEFRIRTATMADVDALLKLVELSVRGLQTNDYSPTQIDASIGSAFGVDRQLIVDETYFVATLAKAPEQFVGCGGWSYRGTLCGSDAMTVTHGAEQRNAAALDPAKDFAKIRAIFVHPAWARRGLGSMILKHAEEAARTAGFTRLEMGSTLTGVALYKLRGYREFERADVPLPSGESLQIIRMAKVFANLV